MDLIATGSASIKPFFILIRENIEGESFSAMPQKRHPTFDEAKAEAERLCEKENRRFFIFETVGFVEQAKPPVVWVPLSDRYSPVNGLQPGD